MRSLAEQHEFNVRRWAELVADPKLAAVPNKIETDADGKIIMSPPADSDHGDRQAEIAYQLKGSLPKGKVITECGVSTSGGTKSARCCVAFITASAGVKGEGFGR